MAEADRPGATGKVRGLHKVDWVFVFSCAAHNLQRLPKLIAEQRTEGLEQQYA